MQRETRRWGGEFGFESTASRSSTRRRGLCRDVQYRHAASGVIASLVAGRRTGLRTNACLPIAEFRP